MEYRPELVIHRDPDVYPPSEDSILLIESLDVGQNEKVLEIGCGSGVVSVHCAAEGCDVTAGDINPKAVDLARKNLEANGLSAKVVETDVYSGVDGMFDTIVFNLPYLPVEENGLLAKAWSGGPNGMGPLPKLLEGAPGHLNEGGRIVVVVSSLMDQDALGRLLEGHEVRILGEMSLFFEKLQVLEIRLRRFELRRSCSFQCFAIRRRCIYLKIKA
jgi:release factor glutamine methyltransferase